MPDPLPPVAGTVVLDINPNDFAPGTKVDGTALTAANTTPVLTPVAANPVYRSNIFGTRGSIQTDGSSGWTVPRPVQDDWTIYLVTKGLRGSGADPNWYNNGALCDAERAFTGDDFGLTLRNDGTLTIGIGNPDTTAASSGVVPTAIIPQVITYTRKKSTGVSKVYLNGTLLATVTGNTNSLTFSTVLAFGRNPAHNQTVSGHYARVVAYDAEHNGTDQASVLANLVALYVDTTRVYGDKLVVYAALGSARLKSTKLVVYTALGQPLTPVLKSVKTNLYAGLGTRYLASRKTVVYGVLGPVAPGPPSEGPEPDVLPPEDCTEDNGQSPGCCVPDLNRVIEARVGVLNTHHDLVVAIQYLQDRHNVLVREFNKLATVTRPNPPSV